MHLEPIGLIAWLALGTLAGWLTGRWRSVGYGALGDVAAGMAGALLGAYVLLLMGAPPDVGLIVTIVVAFAGAALTVLLLHLAVARTSAYWSAES